MNSPGSAAPSDTRDGFTVLLEALEHHGCNPRKVGSQYAARCPAHDDRIPSLTFAPATKRSGAAVLHCQTGCTPDAVLDALELTAAERELILRGHGEAKRAPSPASDAERLEHTYHDAEGKPIARKVRLTLGGMTTKLASGVKALWWEYPYGDDWLTPSKFPKDAPPPQAPRVLYRLPEVLAAKRHGRTVYIPEGEKCCDALAELGLTATSVGVWRSARLHPQNDGRPSPSPMRRFKRCSTTWTSTSAARRRTADKPTSPSSKPSSTRL